METLVGLGVQVVLLVAATKLFIWARKLKAASRSKWRRRMGLLFFLAPILTRLLSWVLPESVLSPLRALTWVNEQLSGLLNILLGVAAENADGLWLIAIRPLCYAAVYGTAGYLVGWPLDRWGAKWTKWAKGAKGIPAADDDLPQVDDLPQDGDLLQDEG